MIQDEGDEMSSPDDAFNWHTLSEYGPHELDRFLRWLVPTVLSDPDEPSHGRELLDQVSDVSDGFTKLTLTMQLNGVEVNARAFVDGVYRSVRRFAHDEALTVLNDAIGYPEFVSIGRELRSTLQEKARRIARELGIDDELDDEDDDCDL